MLPYLKAPKFFGAFDFQEVLYLNFKCSFMRHFLFVFWISLFISKFSTAQTNQSGKYAISIQPLQLFVRDLPITFERIYPRHTLGFTLGWRPSLGWYENPIHIVSYYAGSGQTFTSPRFNGITIGVNSKKYFDRKGVSYLDGQLFYRYWWFNDRRYGTNFSRGDNYNYITSGHTNVLGAKLLLGTKENLSNKGTTRPFCYFYFGLGYRFKMGREAGKMGITNYSIPNPYYQPYEDDFQNRTLTVHMGFNFGIEFFKEKII